MKKLLAFVISLILAAACIFGVIMGVKSCNGRKTVAAVADNVAAFTAPVLNSKTDDAIGSSIVGIISGFDEATRKPNPYENAEDKNTKGEGTTFTTDTMTGYFLELELNGINCVVDYNSTFSELQYNFKKRTTEVTAVITFLDIKYNGRPILVTAPISITSSRGAFCNYNKVNFTINSDLTEANNMALRLPASYYNYLTFEQDENGRHLNNFALVITWNNNRCVATKGSYNCRYRLFTKDIPTDSDDPTSPNFNLDNWAGLMAEVKNNNGCKDFVTWFKNNWKFVLIVVAAILVIGIVVRLIKWLVGK